MKEALSRARAEFRSAAAKVLVEFAASTQRGLCPVAKRARSATGAGGTEGETE